MHMHVECKEGNILMIDFGTIDGCIKFREEIKFRIESIAALSGLPSEVFTQFENGELADDQTVNLMDVIKGSYLSVYSTLIWVDNMLNAKGLVEFPSPLDQESLNVIN